MPDSIYAPPALKAFMEARRRGAPAEELNRLRAACEVSTRTARRHRRRDRGNNVKDTNQCHTQ